MSNKLSFSKTWTLLTMLQHSMLEKVGCYPKINITYLIINNSGGRGY